MAKPRPTNPFSFGAIATDAAFTDRVDEVAELHADATNGQDVVIFAPRRYGKTSLVRRVSEQLTADGALVAEINLMTTPTKEKLAGKLADAINEHLLSPAGKAREQLVRVFGGLRITPTMTVNPDTGALGFAFAAGHTPQDVDDTLAALLELLGQIAKDRKRRVVLVLDEFQEIISVDPTLPRLMRSVFQEQADVSHIYLGSKRHMMQRIFSDENEPFWRSAKPLELGVIRAELFSPFIAGRFQQTGKDVEPATVDALVRATAGHPYATQELAYFLWEETPSGRAATAEHLATAWQKLLRAEHAHLSALWGQATANQRLVLQALAREPGRPQTQLYRATHGLKPNAQTQKALDALVREDVVAKRDGFAWITEPFLTEWILLNAE